MKKYLYQRWESYSSREKSLLAALAIAGILFLIGFGLLSPIMDYQQKGKEKMNKAAEDYLWMVGQSSQFDFIAAKKGEEKAQSGIERITQMLEEYKLPLTVDAIKGQQIALTSSHKPVEFLSLMRFLIYLQAGHNLRVAEIDLAAVNSDSSLVQINQLLLSHEADK